MSDFFVNEKLFEGRPEEKKTDREEKIYDALDSLKIKYKRAEHDASFTIEACLDVEKVTGVMTAKNLFLCNRQCTSFYLLVMPGDKPFKTKDLSSQINSARLSFADEKHMEEFLDTLPGSLSILGLLNDKEQKVRLLIDSDLLKEEYLGFHPCLNTSTLVLKTEDIINIYLPYVKHEPTYVNL
ncbi:MAG: prolyl-tRNA synthetase associated domain-containing protein [Clostridiales bacterium]|nr:prolyl-tRNA synthetase associated domain-containing protein [Clostridiales bacterium]